MEINKYLDTLLDGSGHLNPFPKKLSAKAPDYGGYVKIDDKIYKISAWVHSKGKRKFLSLRVFDFDEVIEISML